ncbi:beta-galactosidase [Oribacterium sp. KHPX15]|uniref:glycoside hydrolase family 2 protein n=1 Tax=Oribacterium sp. KHPX15 TaxID=1855342 RepID=UPI000897294D|nr:glycoside hydrolase family 2 TIM barrel-domain containing protein [Oribacterium sp. KHPX15]SEA49445.1 beta-galactosidase [Oribacterium sp. KHPX15]
MHKIQINEGWQFNKIPDGNIRDLSGLTVDTKVVDSDVISSESFVTVTLPHTWYRDEDPYRGLVLYQKTIQIDPDWKHVFVDIPGADQHAVVLADDRKIGEHRGAYGAFHCEIPEELLCNKEVKLRIFLTNVHDEGISPLTGDFTVFGGLYRGVNLLVTEHESFFDPTYYGTSGVILRTGIDGNTGILNAEIHARTDKEAEIVAEITDPFGTLLTDVRSEEVDSESANTHASGSINCSMALTFRIPDVILWNGKTAPNLYKVKMKLVRAGETLDEVELETGFRDITITADKGLFLNGEHIKINGVAKHQDFKGCFNAVSRENIDRDFELIDEIGANSVRLSHYQHPQYTYETADKKGYLVWAEIPMLKMTDSEELKADAEEQLRELILQNIHHPSIYCWGIQNEIGMFRDAEFMHEELKKMQQLSHELDPSRLVTAANLYTVKFKSKLNSVTDMIGYNIYFGWYYGEMEDYRDYLNRFHEERPEMPLGVSEYGVDANISLHAENPMVRDYSEEYQALYHETVYHIFESLDHLYGSYVWNMFDFHSGLRNEGGQKNINAKGLVTYDRNTRKDAFYYYKAKWSEEKFLHICSKRFVNRAKESIEIKVYTNLSDAVLYVDEKEFGSGTNDGNGRIIFSDVPLHEGENRIKVAAEGLTDECVFVRVDSEDENYRLPGNNAGQAVKNWFLSDDDVVREGYFSLKDTANDLLDDPDARAVLEKYLPELVKFMTEKDVIPLGLSMQSILSRDIPEGLDLKELNRELNQIKNEF